MNHWTDDARCVGADLEMFYPEGGQQTEARYVIDVYCNRCPVRDACLAQAEREEITHVDIHGIRGGLTRWERRARLIARNEAANANKPATPTGCGTYQGYSQHRREHTPTCEPCREASRQYQTEKRARRRNQEKIA